MIGSAVYVNIEGGCAWWSDAGLGVRGQAGHLEKPTFCMTLGRKSWDKPPSAAKEFWSMVVVESRRHLKPPGRAIVDPG